MQQQTATADVLKVISRSTFDLQTVLDALTKSAAQLCAADKGLIFRPEGEVLRLVANYGFSREAERYWLDIPPVDRGSVTGRALLEGRAVHVSEVLADLEYRATHHQELAGYRTVLAVPLLRGGTTIGVFGLTRDEVNPFTEMQIELVTTFADQAVIAIENVRLFEAEQQRTRELAELLEQQTAISEILRVISNSPSDVQPVLDSLAEHAARICEAQVVDIVIVYNEVFWIAASFGELSAAVERRTGATGPRHGDRPLHLRSAACPRRRPADRQRRVPARTGTRDQARTSYHPLRAADPRRPRARRHHGPPSRGATVRAKAHRSSDDVR